MPEPSGIDRRARLALAARIERLTSRAISTWEFEDSLPKSSDPSIQAIGDSLWLLYPDFPNGKLPDLSEADMERVERILRFLKSAASYDWPRLYFRDGKVMWRRDRYSCWVLRLFGIGSRFHDAEELAGLLEWPFFVPKRRS